MASAGTLLLTPEMYKMAIVDVIDWVCYTPDSHPILTVKDYKMSRLYFNPPNQRRLLIVLVITLLFVGITVSCSSTRDKTSPENNVNTKTQTQIIPAAGGTLDFDNGVQMVFPPDAVSTDTDLTINLLNNADVKEILDKGDFPVQPLVFIAISSKAQELNNPVQITFPVSSPVEGWPIPILLDLDSETVEYLPNDLIYDPEKGTVTFSSDHFSSLGVGTTTDDEKEKKCNDPGGACRCGRIYVKSSFHDYTIGDCQSVSDEVSVQFLDCPGQPTEKHKMSEIAGDCIAMGSLAFHGKVVAEGYEIQMNCRDSIPFIIGGSNSILGGGPMQCIVNEDIEGMMIDMFVDEQVSLTGKFDGVNLNFDPPEAENISGYMKAWAMLEGEEFIIIDMVFDDETASADAGVFRGMTMLSFSTPTDSSEIDRSQFAFSIPLDTNGQTEIVMQEEGATVILTITMELDY